MISSRMTFQQVEQEVDKLPPPEQLKLVAHIGERLSALTLAETNQKHQHEEYAAQVEAFLTLCDEMAAEPVGEVNSAEDIRQIREEMADGLLAELDAIADSIEGEFDSAADIRQIREERTNFENETDTAIRKRVHDGKLTITDANKAFAGLDTVIVQVITHPNLRRRAREIAEQFNQRTVYDATYAALAELRSCEFWTADKAFYDAVRATLQFVKYLPDYPFEGAKPL